MSQESRVKKERVAMSKLIFKNQGKKISLEEIASFEKAYNLLLPQDYKKFLLKNNGGIPNKVYYLENDADLVVNFFLSLGSSKYSLEEYIEDLKINQQCLPNELIAMGEDAFGNILCLSFESESKGNVFVWNHETENIKFISNSVNDLLNNLKENI